MSEKITASKDKLKLARKLSALYSAAVALSSAIEEIENRTPSISVKLEGDTFSVSAGNIRFGSKFDGL